MEPLSVTECVVVSVSVSFVLSVVVLEFRNVSLLVELKLEFSSGNTVLFSIVVDCNRSGDCVNASEIWLLVASLLVLWLSGMNIVGIKG